VFPPVFVYLFLFFVSHIFGRQRKVSAVGQRGVSSLFQILCVTQKEGGGDAGITKNDVPRSSFFHFYSYIRYTHHITGKDTTKEHLFFFHYIYIHWTQTESLSFYHTLSTFALCVCVLRFERTFSFCLFYITHTNHFFFSRPYPQGKQQRSVRDLTHAKKKITLSFPCQTLYA